MANVVITGANRGIGLELARLYEARGDSVTAICREGNEEIEDIADQVIAGIDVTDEENLPKVVGMLHKLLDGPVDILINNAGLFTNETVANMSLEGIRQQMEVNAIAPLNVTMNFLPLMTEGSKVANITSRMGSIADNTSGGYFGYRASKAALNAIGKSLAIDLKPAGVAVAQIHPGYVQTRMVGFTGDITPADAAAGIAARIDELTLENSGGFWHSNGQALPW
ncbi:MULTISPECIES: SDR family oxidoreductase [Thalassolituus]|uniref:Short-chain alcohol dehydrogenase-like protein n=3 Tax=root TaxID=1 RepID=M5DTE9_9GAMM|nr:short-chain dehydrogenase [Thalassolituus oleivorans]MCA6128900.1 short-chain dehydrogenase [Thalassolituus oleivorans 4BN06-13]PCI49122.1 MAG: short-chain dehydrogenase [Oceanospirillales bacterium]CCU72477.1 short-chain alcohol dehydrogenase-like protein [Thalassolituus oleivorans MIL-1]